ncbi:hypothetical protein CBL_06276 [Carabus blaptoides fortunei]
MHRGAGVRLKFDSTESLNKKPSCTKHLRIVIQRSPTTRLLVPQSLSRVDLYIHVYEHGRTSERVTDCVRYLTLHCRPVKLWLLTKWFQDLYEIWPMKAV